MFIKAVYLSTALAMVPTQFSLPQAVLPEAGRALCHIEQPYCIVHRDDYYRDQQLLQRATDILREQAEEIQRLEREKNIVETKLARLNASCVARLQVLPPGRKT